MAIENSWWAEKYRPTTIKDYVADPEFLSKIEGWIEKGEINHLLLYSEKSGTGKTTLAKMLANSLDADVMYINASSENNVDTVREKITTFVSTIGFARWKILILDEFPQFSLAGQSALNAVMETYSKHCRFIITGNYVEKILPSIRSRCTQFQIESPPKTAILKRMQYILDSENVTYENKDIAVVIKDFYPDQRSIINYLQDNSVGGKFNLSKSVAIINDYCNSVIELLQSKKSAKDLFVEIRQLIANAKVRQFNDLFKILFEQLDSFTPDGKKGLVIIAIADAQYKDAFVTDKEINAMALIVNILNIIKG